MTNEREAPLDEVIAELQEFLEYRRNTLGAMTADEDADPEEIRAEEICIAKDELILRALKEMQSRQGEAVALETIDEHLRNYDLECNSRCHADAPEISFSEYLGRFAHPPSQPVELDNGDLLELSLPFIPPKHPYRPHQADIVGYARAVIAADRKARGG